MVALVAVVVFQERTERALPEHRLLLIHVLIAKFAEQRAQSLLDELHGERIEVLAGHVTGV